MTDKPPTARGVAASFVENVMGGKVPNKPEIEPDPHGIIEVFARNLNHNLALMHPETAAREAMASVDGFLRASKFIDMSYKGSERQYVRVDKRPEEMGGAR